MCAAKDSEYSYRIWVRLQPFGLSTSGVSEEEGALRNICCGAPFDCSHCLTEILYLILNIYRMFLKIL